MSDPSTRTDDPLLADLAQELAGIDAEGRRRVRPVIDGPGDRLIHLCAGSDGGQRSRLINWASNDYLGLANHRALVNGALRAARRYGAGSGAARLLGGGLRCHRRLEQRLAAWLGSDDCVTTSTGYQANLAVVTSLAGSSEDAVVLDRLCHASTYDGARLAAGGLLRFAHNDPEDLDRRLQQCESARRKIVCIESVYSMDGDAAPVAALAAVCARRGALLVVDEAHAIGVVGPGGRGACAAAGARPHALIGTCSKSLGSQGGFIAGSRTVVELVVNRGRSFIYTTAPVPAAAGAAVAALDRLRKDPSAGARLLARAAGLRAQLRQQGWTIGDGDGPIIPIIVGDEARALALATALRERGHYAPAIRPPTVPPGACRLRLTLTLAHQAVDERRLVTALSELRA
jgi:8-amino-7-oxononanoate synthase